MEGMDSTGDIDAAIIKLATAISSLNDGGESLCDPVALELDVARLGLWPREDWSLQHFPTELYEYCGFGLGIWQYPKQLIPLLVLLHRYDTSSHSLRR